jgi:2-hydroxycyclohexanecarboxyl-CoA dehydrogenase
VSQLDLHAAIVGHSRHRVRSARRAAGAGPHRHRRRSRNGAAVARRLHAQCRRVVPADLLTTEAEALADELDGHAYRCDVTDSDGVRDMVSAIETDLGSVDALVNCAGFDRFVRFVDTDEDFWDTIIDINYKGTLRTCHAVLPGMTERGWGRIVNFASDAARVGSSLESVYAGAKPA